MYVELKFTVIHLNLLFPMLSPVLLITIAWRSSRHFQRQDFAHCHSPEASLLLYVETHINKCHIKHVRERILFQFVFIQYTKLFKKLKRQNNIYYISTEIYSLKWHCVIIVRNFATANLRRERWNFTSETTSFAPSDWTNDVFSLVKMIVLESSFVFHHNFFGAKPISIWKSKWLRDLRTPFLLTILFQNKKIKLVPHKKNERDVKLLLYYTCFWKPRMKKEKWKIFWEQNWTSTCLSLSIRPKDGKEYEPSSLRSLLAIFERHLKKKLPGCKHYQRFSI
jgi:hypothetical protein